MMNNKKIRFILSIFLIIFAIVQLYPLIWLIFLSLKDTTQINGTILDVMWLPKKFIWGNYKEAMLSSNLKLYFFNSLLITGTAIIISNILACMASYGIVRLKWHFSKPTLTYFLLGMMLPMQAALYPLFDIFNKTNLYNTRTGVTITYIAFSLPIAIFIMTSFLQSIPKEYEEAAFIDGCSIYYTFFKIIIPVLKPAIATISIFTFLFCWNEFLLGLTLLDDDKLTTITVGINKMVGQYDDNWGPMCAGLVISSLPTFIMYMLFNKKVQESIISGSIKG